MLLHDWWLVPVGFAVGTYGTLIGAGGGFVLMPVLLILYPREAPDLLTSISLAVVFLNALSGSAAYARMRRIDYRAGLMFAAAATPGAVVGAFTTALIPRRAFDFIFGVLMVAGAVFLAVFPPQEQAGRERRSGSGVHHVVTDREGTVYEYSFRPLVGMAISIFVGFASSFLGIGGGIIHVPALVHLMSFPVHVATATSHFILAFMTLAGTAAHAATGVFAHGLYRTVTLGAGVVGGAQLGAFLSNRIKGAWIIRALAVALGGAGVRILVSLL